MSKSIEFQGKRYATQQVSAFVDRLAAADDELDLYVNVASLQAVLYGNVNWLNAIMQSSSMRLKSGKLNRRGNECLDYIRDHVPCILWNVQENRIQMKKLKSGNKLIGKFRIPFETFIEEGTERELDVLVCALEYPTFRYSLADWRDVVASRDVEEPAPSNKKAQTLITQLETMAALLLGEKDAKVIATRQELLTLMEKAAAVENAAAYAAAQLEGDAIDIEEKLAQRAAETTGKAETRADVDREEHDAQQAATA